MPVLRIIFFIILAIVAIKLFFFAVGIFTLLAWALTGILVLAGIGWLIYQLVFNKGSSKSVTEVKVGPQVYNHTGNVVLFQEKPDLLQITKVDDTAAGIIKIPNGENIKVIEESDNVLKVKVLAGAHKNQVAWVSKSDVTGYKK